MDNKSRVRHGFTLVEILVVIVIATVVISIAIPRIRTISQERTIREAARGVGSAFANASQRAVSDGVAGIRISRNPNFLQGSRRFAATEVSTLRRVPNYVGDELGATITNAIPFGMPDNLVSIPQPLEQTDLNIVSAGDLISFGGSNTQYRILEVNENTNETGGSPTIGTSPMQLVLDLAGYLPAPNDGASFSITRRPRLLRSSVSVLPANHIIDLRFSGFEVLDGFGPIRPDPASMGSIAPDGTVLGRQLTTVFEPAPTDFSAGPLPGVENYDIDVIFDNEGAIDFLLYTEVGDEDMDGIFGETIVRLPLGPLYLFVTEAPDSVETTETVAVADDNSLWVTIGNSGGANVGSNNPTANFGLTVANFSDFYFEAMTDLDFVEEDDRDEFNALIRQSRNGAASVSANQ